ncbi:MAG: alpha/beta fold hydrolase [Proteobacteria bacterium]|nr:alpha/beta fold hydrolase [Pseudomonadota bacterium]
MKQNNQPFLPSIYLRNSYVQTILASSKLRVMGQNPMVDNEKEIILDAGGGIRLQGFLSRPKCMQPKGIIILIHGWEGSASSTYILSTGRYLFRMGYSVFRLNLRDHGNSHHLNEGLFYAIILDEVFNSVRQAAQMENGRPAFLAGFSLGGNFVLRIAKKCISTPIPNLKHIVAISPGLNPTLSTEAIDKDLLLKHYFLKKWRTSLKKKEKIFPHLYRFNDLLSAKTVRRMTDLVLARYSKYGETLSYFKGYTLTGNALQDISISTTIITAQDDPIIPVDDFKRLVLNGSTELIIHRFGGHNGFIETIPFQCWYEKKIVDIVETHAK